MRRDRLGNDAPVPCGVLTLGKAESSSMLNPTKTRITLTAIPFSLVAALALFPLALRAQNPRGTLLVAVQDSSGARIAGANVSLTQDEFANSRARSQIGVAST